MPAQRSFALPALAVMTLLAACAGPASQTRMGPDGRPLPVVYRISAGETERIRVRMLDGLNSVRTANGLTPVTYNAQLSSVAATQARDMSAQGRPWHFGADGSSPLERVQRVGYTGNFRGELLSETYETELETLAAWMQGRESRPVLLDPRVNEIGFAWYQDNAGKIWWVLSTGTAG